MKSLKAKDFMTKYVFTVSPDTTVQELVGLFVTHPVSAIPVVGDDNELLGIVSEGDLLYKKVQPKIPPHVDVLGGTVYYCGFGRYEKSFRKLLATTAKDIMTTDVRCVTPETDMEAITTLMNSVLLFLAGKREGRWDFSFYLCAFPVNSFAGIV